MSTINQRTKEIINLTNSRAFKIADRCNKGGEIVQRRLSVSLADAGKFGLVEHLLNKGFAYNAGRKDYSLVLS